MPELPEVENVKIQLNRKVAGLDHLCLLKVEFVGKALRKNKSAEEFKTLIGQKLLGFSRRAKYLLFVFEQRVLLNSLGMTGSWKINPAQLEIHDHFVFHFSKQVKLVYHDPRRFGFFEIYNDLLALEKAKKLGPEPLPILDSGAQFEFESFFQNLKQKNQNIKTALMDPQIVVGVGNIYASEILFQAKIKPQKKASSLKKDQALRLVQCMQEVLQKSIQMGGSTIRDFKSLDSILGNYQDQHYVYGRNKKPCLICHTPIRQQFQSGRSTFWCPECQNK